jgi:site-specific DNA-methyltransferase (adenine-specific)
MSLYYEDDVVRLYHADADDALVFSIVPDTIDLILTDPPYNVSDRNGRERTTVGTLKRKDGTKREVVRNFGEWDHGWNPDPFFVASRALLKDGAGLVAFTSEFLMGSFIASGLSHRSLVYWRKVNPAPSFGRLYGRAVEMAVWQTKGKGWTFNGDGSTQNVYEGPILSGFSTVNNAEPRIHPTQKPLWLMQRLIATHSNEGDLILDPYAGSGTTLEAAKRMGRKAVGIEIDERYCEAAAKRLAQQTLDFGVAA